MDEEMLKAVVPFVLGIVAGVISYIITLGDISRDPIGIIVLVLIIYANKFVLPRLNVKQIKPMDWLTISVVCFATWYMIWTFLMNF